MVENNIFHTVINGDSIEYMKGIKSNSIDLIFADPPYNLQLKKDLYRPNNTIVKGVDNSWDKFDSFTAYDSFSQEWLQESRRILKEDGSIFVMGSYHNIFRIGKILQDLHFWIINDIIWYKVNSMPNFKGVRLTNSHETIIWASKSKDSKYTINYKHLKILNDDIQMKSIWRLPICSGNERLKNEENETLHPTQKPQSLLKRIILGFSKEQDIILDPFGGTGTTIAMAKMYNRSCISIDKEKKYCDFAKQRISTILPSKDLIKPIDKEKIRVSIMDLIDYNYLSPLDTLYSPCKKYQIIISQDGSAIMNNEKGSIHSTASSIMGIKTNGWDYWHYKQNKSYFKLDKKRQQYIQNNK